MLVVIWRVIEVTVSNPGVINVSWSENAAPSFTIHQRGIASKFGEVQWKFTPPPVCSFVVVGVGLIYPVSDSILCPDAEYEYPVLYWWLVIVSFITCSDVLVVWEVPERNCGTIGTARVLTGNTNKTSSQSLVNRNSNFSRSYAACTRSTSSTGMNSTR